MGMDPNRAVIVAVQLRGEAEHFRRLAVKAKDPYYFIDKARRIEAKADAILADTNQAGVCDPPA